MGCPNEEDGQEMDEFGERRNPHSGNHMDPDCRWTHLACFSHLPDNCRSFQHTFDLNRWVWCHVLQRQRACFQVWVIRVEWIAESHDGRVLSNWLQISMMFFSQPAAWAMPQPAKQTTPGTPFCLTSWLFFPLKPLLPAALYAARMDSWSFETGSPNTFEHVRRYGCI